MLKSFPFAVNFCEQYHLREKKPLHFTSCMSWNFFFVAILLLVLHGYSPVVLLRFSAQLFIALKSIDLNATPFIQWVSQFGAHLLIELGIKKKCLMWSHKNEGYIFRCVDAFHWLATCHLLNVSDSIVVDCNGCSSWRRVHWPKRTWVQTPVLEDWVSTTE